MKKNSGQKPDRGRRFGIRGWGWAGWALGLAIGILFGIAIGSAIGNVLAGIAIGLGLGAALGLVYAQSIQGQL